MKLTDAAAARIREIMADADGQLSGRARGRHQWRLRRHEPTRWITPKPRRPLEEVVEDKGVKIFIDPKAILFLIGTEMDFVREKLGARFVFNNPNQTAACGCGESVSITPVKAD